jgi:hypothetical protein
MLLNPSPPGTIAPWGGTSLVRVCLDPFVRTLFEADLELEPTPPVPL